MLHFPLLLLQIGHCPVHGGLRWVEVPHIAPISSSYCPSAAHQQHPVNQFSYKSDSSCPQTRRWEGKEREQNRFNSDKLPKLSRGRRREVMRGTCGLADLTRCSDHDGSLRAPYCRQLCTAAVQHLQPVKHTAKHIARETKQQYCSFPLSLSPRPPLTPLPGRRPCWPLKHGPQTNKGERAFLSCDEIQYGNSSYQRMNQSSQNL